MLISCIPFNLKEIYFFNLLMLRNLRWEKSVLYMLGFMVFLNFKITSVMIYIPLIDPNEL